VETESGPAKSYSSETTFDEDVSDMVELEAVVARMSRELCEGLGKKGRRGRTIGIKVRLSDWTNATRARSIEVPTNDVAVVNEIARDLLRLYAPPQPVRLIGVRIAGFEDVVEPPRPAAPPVVGQLVLDLF
jgi:DNA polymerase-4